MCGIVGHLGPQNSIKIILEGLRRLEYRGYDSAGISFINQQEEIFNYKKEGKIDKLVELLDSKDIDKQVARLGIGHTRWATHGGVNDENAHPHSHEYLSMVHNGIIENASELRKELAAEGYKFLSQTDSEVALALTWSKLSNGSSLEEAIAYTYSRVTGNSAFVAMDAKSLKIVAIKKSAPLVCGIHDKNSEVILSSDPYALVGMVDKLYFPEDGVLCSISASNKNLLNFYELDLSKSTRYLSKKQDLSLDVSDKGDFEHFMLKEIHEQPELVRSLTQYYFDGEGHKYLERMTKITPTTVHTVACGTAYYAGLTIKDFFERENKIPFLPDLASEFRYREPLIQKGELGLFVSQSGETADTLAAQELCKKNGIDTASIVNVEGSTLYRECTENLLIRAGVEIGVASTKAFTQQVLTGKLLSFALSGSLGQKEKEQELKMRFNLLAERIDEVLNRSAEIKSIAESIYNENGFFFTGRGIYYPIALEGALKLKEIAYVHAEGYAAGELKHGPIALIDEHMVNIAVVGPELFDKTISNIQEIKARKGIILTIGPKDSESLKEVSDFCIELNFDGLGDLSPLYVNVVNQLLAYYMALFKGTDIDKPRNLAKSVTVE